jgi:hypothetical protein
MTQTSEFIKFDCIKTNKKKKKMSFTPDFAKDSIHSD